jgi:hypothetical protein
MARVARARFMVSVHDPFVTGSDSDPGMACSSAVTGKGSPVLPTKPTFRDVLPMVP